HSKRFRELLTKKHLQQLKIRLIQLKLIPLEFPKIDGLPLDFLLITLVNFKP
ncbi:hypothetical protein PanWU01x14_255530, partial [Parasponia andersonii]